MIVDNPEVTLDIEAHGFPEDARDAPFLDWLCSAVVRGDDGCTYWFGTSPLILGLEQRDIWNIEASWERGRVVPVPGTIFKLADFPGVGVTGQHAFPGGTLKVERSETQVRVTLGEHFEVICKEDHTWHDTVEDAARGIKLEFAHIGTGCPLWYGREKPSYLTPHSIAYGYNWSGRIEGKLTLQGREIAVKGKGIRERYIAVDSSAAEIGGWEDWGWFHFDEVFGSMYEMKLSQKDMVLNLAEEGQFFPAGGFTIEHDDWAWLRALGAFIPTRYRVRMEVEGRGAGVHRQRGRRHGLGRHGDRAQHPRRHAELGRGRGDVTYRDGRTKTLTNGMGGMSIRQWKPYPDVFGAALGSAAGLTETGRMTTL